MVVAKYTMLQSFMAIITGHLGKLVPGCQNLIDFNTAREVEVAVVQLKL